eukprot:ctg_2287.g614
MAETGATVAPRGECSAFAVGSARPTGATASHWRPVRAAAKCRFALLVRATLHGTRRRRNIPPDPTLDGPPRTAHIPQ